MISSVFLLFWTGMLSSGLGGNLKSNPIPSVAEYFPELNGDLTKLHWAHAVNNQSLLQKALTDKAVMMLEADIVLGTLIGQKEKIPIMAHPPKQTSDLSLQMFMEAVIDAQKDKRKGVKLDFKSTESFESSMYVIDPLKSKISFPVFLNADIIKGPVKSTTKPVDPVKFLNISSVKFPSSTLSIGWTTRLWPLEEGNYTEEQLNNMKEAIESNKVMQPVTLCLRAGIAAKTKNIESLVEQIDQFQKSNKTSVTIWMSSDTDSVDVPKLRDLIFSLKKSRVYLDVPKFIQDKLNLDSNSARTPISAAQGALVALLTSVSSIFSSMFRS